MPQFRSLPSFQTLPAIDLAEEQPEPRQVTPSELPPLPLFARAAQQSPVVTGDLASISTMPHPVITTEQLAAIAGSSYTPYTSTPFTPAPAGRIVRIPGVPSKVQRRTTPTTEDLPAPVKRMNPRLRQGIILLALFVVGLMTLLTLVPLDNGQSAFPIFKGISSWVQSEQAYWELQAQIDQTAQATTQNIAQPAAPPPVALPTSVYISVAQQDAINAGISPDYFVRQINTESGFNPYAVSPSGAEGIAQFMPSTAASLGIDPFNPYQALNAAAHLMASYNNQYGGNYAMALAAYNGGSGTVQYAINACGMANWMNCLPAQTRNYIYVIMGI